MGVLVKLIAALAVALEAANRIHAGAVLTCAGHQLTFIYFSHAAGHRVDHKARTSLTAQLCVGLGTLTGTLLAGVAPASSHGAAANHPRLRLGHWRGTGSVRILHKTVFLFTASCWEHRSL